MYRPLADQHARNGSRDAEALNLTRALEDGVDSEVAHNYPRQRFFPNWAHPQMKNIDPSSDGFARFCTRFVGSERAP